MTTTQLPSTAQTTKQNGNGKLLDLKGETLTGQPFEIHGLQPETRVAALTATILAKLKKDDQTPYALRVEDRYLDEDRSVGEQVEPGQRVTLTPKAHLGSP